MDKRRGRPFPDAVILKPLVFDLEEVLSEEITFRPNLLTLGQVPSGEVTLALRDAAVQMLKFLRAWFDLPHSVFFSAASYLDMFLARMRVQEKYMRCLTLGCLNLACKNESCKVDVQQLVKLTQSKCTAGDVERMTGVVKDKLKVGEMTATAADFLKIYLGIFECVTKHWEHIVSKDLNLVKEKMLVLLEVLIADSMTAYIRPSAAALIVFQNEVEKIMALGVSSKSVFFLGEVLQFLAVVREIQLKCKIKNSELKLSYLQISKILKQYDSQNKVNSGQKLNWNFSPKTIQTAMNRNNYYPMFRKISE